MNRCLQYLTTQMGTMGNGFGSIMHYAGSRSLKPIRDMYAMNPKGDLKSMLIGTLGKLHASEYVDEFIKEYKSLNKDDGMRGAFAMALGDFSDARAFDILSEGVLDKNNNSRRPYAIALEKIPDLRKWDVFYQVWNDKSEKTNLFYNMRSVAAAALAGSSSPYGLEAAQWLLDHGNVFEKVSLIKKLGEELGYRDKTAALKLLKYALKDSSEIVRNAAKVELELEKIREEHRE